MIKILRKAARNSGKFMEAVKVGLGFNGNFTVELSLNSAAHNGILSLDRIVALELLDIDGGLVSSKAITLQEIAEGNGEVFGSLWRKAIDGPDVAEDPIENMQLHI